MPSAAGRPNKKRHNYALGASLIFNNRTGYFMFDPIETKIDTARPAALLGELSLAKRYTLTRLIRWQVAGAVGFGRVVEDTLPLHSGEYIQEKSLVNLGLESDFHLMFPTQGRMSPFLLAGGGLCLFRFQEHYYPSNNPQTEEDFEGAAGGWRLTPNFEGGFGTDILIKRDLYVGATYTFRYWRPIHYEYQRDLPLNSVPYWEQFLTHAFRVYVAFTLSIE
ncbi:MAG: hypothetical protein GF363_14335 [Chitinivibrionales bacterium]|nr:hypothetical protein [Chitinivibrionales bacterium]